jgi:uncharacterized membrane protein YraQ (UPF0718 family)
MVDKATKATAVRRISWFIVGGVVLTAAILWLSNQTQNSWLSGRFPTFVTIFLGIFIEAVPFLTAGAIVSGFIEVFVSKQALDRIIPRNPIAGSLMGSLLGFVLPVCECGVVPVTRRLYQKGLPLSVGISFLLAAPVINPIVFASTYAAFGWGPMLIGRFAFTILIAFLIGLIFYFAQPEEVLLPESPESVLLPDSAYADGQSGGRIWQALSIAGDDFTDMGRYLIIGSMLAAGMQTIVPQSTLLAIGSDAFLSVVALITLAFVLSLCSTVDAFVALSFITTFSPAAILGFLVFGPMVDIKSALMFLSIFRRRVVFYLVLLPMAMTLVIALYLNLNVAW